MLFLLKIAAFLIGRVPLKVSSFLSGIIGPLICRLDRKHREIVLGNLDLAFGDGLSRERKEEIAAKVFKNLVMTFFEFMLVPWLKRKDLEGYVEFEGLEKIEKALERKNGLILVTAHFGNWELLAASLGLSGHSIDIIARELDNPSFEEFVRWARTRPGNRVVSKNRSMRRLLKSLSQNRIAGVLIDQNVALSEGVFADFFGTPACTNRGPALLASASSSPVIPIFIVRRDRAHRVIVGDEIELIDTGDRELDAAENTSRFTKAVEEVVRKYPEQWFWVHRRWKTRPPKG
ncbi:MAG: lysophospholipid acyltransferase family protein [Deltaproteobacteria bacterium]|nr:lysophospholipid acyltransferase family protein [Deltaproteobacteria bacterium]